MRIGSKFRGLREQAETGELLSKEQTQILIRYILRGAGSLGTAAMLSGTLPILRYALKTALERESLKSYTVADLRPQVTMWFLGIAFLCLFYGLYSLYKIHRIIRYPICLKEQEAKQIRKFWGKQTEGGPIWFFAAISIAVGIILALAVPDLMISEYILPFIVMEILTFGAGIRAFVSYLIRRCISCRLKLVSAEGTSEADQKMKKSPGSVLWVLYWLLIIALYLTGSFLFSSFLLYLYIPLIGLLQFGIFRAANRVFQLKTERVGWILVLRNILAGATVVLLCWLGLISGSWINNVYIYSLDYQEIDEAAGKVEYDENTGVYTITTDMQAEEGEFRILQLTDIHLGGSLTTVYPDRRALNACYEVIRRAEPDLIIITGDIAYPIPLQSFTLNNKTPFFQLREFMSNIGIPWVIVYGNHDTETKALWSGEEISRSYAAYARQNPQLLYADRQPDIYGRYNQYIRIQNQDGSLNRILFLMDSNAYVADPEGAGKYDSVHTDQIQWYTDTIRRISREEEKNVPSFVFMHIPLPAFAQAQEALEREEPEAEYLFGQNAEKINSSVEDHGFFSRMKEEKSTEAVFVGHDHLNNMGIKYQGIDLIYGKSIDYIAYPGIADRTEQRGGTLIRLFYRGYTVEQVGIQ